MNRRAFLKAIVAGTAVAAAPRIVRATQTSKKEPTHGILFDEENKVISIAEDAEPMTVLEFHRKLSDLWDRNLEEAAKDKNCSGSIIDPSPSCRVTDQMVNMINGYTVCDSSVAKLSQGTILYEGVPAFSSVVSFGTLTSR